MIQLTSPKTVKMLLNKYGVAPHKQFGQNFLFDANSLESIASAADMREKNVLEIGPGMGALTQLLAQRAQKVLTVEIDKGFLPILAETLASFDNIEVVHADFLKLDLNDLHERLGGGQISVCANLPYYISTPIIMRLFESGLPIQDMVFLIQKEVAERLSASPGQKNYGSLSVVAQYYASIEVAAKVGAACFFPAPKVDSVVLKLAIRPERIKVNDDKRFFALIRAAFAMRRKTLVNNISAGFPDCQKDRVQNAITALGHNIDVRAEMLTVSDFAELSNSLGI